MLNLLSGIDKCRTVSSENDDSLVEICSEGIVQGDKKKKKKANYEASGTKFRSTVSSC